jgi:hypothetical protein
MNNNLQRFFFILISLLLFSFGFAQDFEAKGKVVDSKSNEPLAFVNIIVNDGKYGGATDIDGSFHIKSNEEIHSLIFSYVGYEKLRLEPSENLEKLRVALVSRAYDLSEVVILPGENPAHRIINQVIENRKYNDPENISSFSYTAYEKMIFTAETDTLKQTDSKVDTAEIRLKEFLDEQHFFMMESVTKRKHLAPDKSYQKVIANRVSGFKDPLFIFLISQMQSFSFYKPMIQIFDKNYINPISKGSLNKYFFLLEDTTYQDKDTVFIISFRPRINTNFDGLKGLLYINTNGFAIQNVIAEPSRNDGGIGIKIQQKYEFFDGKKWFPVQLNTDLTFGNITANNSKLIGKGKSYLRDIVLNEEFVKREFSNIEIDVDPNASFRSDDYWNQYRIDSLDKKEQKTYHVIDSLGKEYNLDKKAATFEALLTGKIPWGIVEFDINKFMRYNDHEGFYLGLGIHTSDRLSRFVKFGGYWGYGFRDKSAKYGGDIMLNMHRNSELQLRFSYMNDLMESGGVEYFDKASNVLSNDMLRDFLLQRMDKQEMIKIDMGLRSFKYLKMNMALSQTWKEPVYNYFYGTSENKVTVGLDEYIFTEFTLGLRYAYNEKFIRNSRKKISLGTNYPIILFQYTHGFDNFLDGQYSYNRYDFRLSKSIYIKYFGRSSVQLNAGYVDENIPATNLYNGHGSYRKFTIFAPNSFATMRMNEFLVNKYVSLFYQHNFGKLLVRTKIFAPEISIAANIGFGWLNHPDSHFDISTRSFDQGYYETGLLLNNILDLGFYNIGTAVFYRYGPYSFERTSKNLAWKLTLLIPM